MMSNVIISSRIAWYSITFTEEKTTLLPAACFFMSYGHANEFCRQRSLWSDMEIIDQLDLVA